MHWGFIPGSRASLSLDLLIISMLVSIPLMTYSIRCARNRLYSRHKRTQMAALTILLIPVIYFEIDIRLYGWTHLAEVSPFYESWVFPVLTFHIIFATSLFVMLVYTFVTAITRNKISPTDQLISSDPHHRRRGKITYALTVMTAVSGYLFYWLAFVASS